MPRLRDELHGGWLPLVMKPPRPAPGSMTMARSPRRELVERDFTAWTNEFLRAPDEAPPPSVLPLVFSVPPPCLPPRHDALEQDLAAWSDDFLLGPDEPPPPSVLPLVFSVPPPSAPPRREPSMLPVAA